MKAGARVAAALAAAFVLAAACAGVKQAPPEALSQLARLESHAEGIFKDRPSVDANGIWRCPDQTVPGRFLAARALAREEGPHVPATTPPEP